MFGGALGPPREQVCGARVATERGPDPLVRAGALEAAGGIEPPYGALQAPA